MNGSDTTSTLDVEDPSWAEKDGIEMPRLVVALSLLQPLVLGMRISMASANELLLGRGAPRRIAREGGRVEVTIEDQVLSRQHLRLRRRQTGRELEDLNSKNGTMVNGERRTRVPLEDSDVIEAGATILLFREDRVSSRSGIRECRDRDLTAESESGGPAVFRTLALDLEWRLADLVRIARPPVQVLLRGESGTGKELIARPLHGMSGRSGAFVAINCGALPRTPVETELFGYRRGSFSDAREVRDGLVRQAHGGTLFLDEIAELPLESQLALLRVLQDGEVRLLEAIDGQPVDVRVVAATHQNLAKRTAMGQFRHDLYARLIEFERELPPLRDRREDLGTLIAAILRRQGCDAERVTFYRQAARALFHHSYRFNIRELEQAVRTAVALADGLEIRLEHPASGDSQAPDGPHWKGRWQVARRVPLNGNEMGRAALHPLMLIRGIASAHTFGVAHSRSLERGSRATYYVAAAQDAL